MRDPLYKAIREGLKERLDSDTFDKAVCDLLRDAFPSLAVVSGGSDDGMDGTFDENGFLVATTGQDVIGNLTRNLKQHKKVGGTRTRVVLATSQSLTQQRKRNLENRAKELGFKLLQVFDRDTLVPRLHRNPVWRKELLGLTGAPPALSTIPATRRPLLNLDLVGREEAFAWLSEETGDRVVVGGPGSGKTAILAQLASNGWGLFVADANRDALADAILEQQPSVVIVDDAQSDPEFLTKLRQLRSQVGANFDIVAATWEGQASTVREHLGAVPDEQIYELPLLTRDQLVEVVKRVGIEEPVDLVRAIVDQSANQPGLAVTLTQATLQGDIEGLRTGRSIADYVVTWLDRVEVQKSVLAAIAAGGKTGMDVAALADELSMAQPELFIMVSHAAAAGIVVAHRNHADRVALRPQALRARLVADVFFPSTGPGLSYDDVASRALDVDEALKVLVHAALIGARIPPNDLRDRVTASNDPIVWALYIQLGQSQAEWAIDHCPTLTGPIIGALLHVIPERALEVLSGRAVEDSRSLAQTPDHPRRIIGEWACSLEIPSAEMRKRRETVVAVAERLEGTIRESGVAAQIACSALSPKIESTSMDAGVGKTFTMRWGIVPLEVLESIKLLWSRVQPLIAEAPHQSWSSVTEILHQWTFPDATVPNTKIPSDLSDQIREFATQVVTDLAQTAENSPGLINQLAWYAQELGVPLPEPNRDFATLFPREVFGEDRGEREARQLGAVEDLVGDLLKEPIPTILARLAAVEREATAAGIDYPRLTPKLCEHLAERLPDPIAPLVDGVLDANLRPDLALPFLARLRQENPSHWEHVVEAMFGDPAYRLAACWVAIRAEDLPERIREMTLEALPDFPRVAETASFGGEVPQDTLLLLLEHHDPEVALETAVGLRNSDGELASFPEPIKLAWQRAVLRTADLPSLSRPTVTAHWLGEILASDRQLSLAWMTRRLKSNHNHHDVYLDNKDVVSRALSSFSREDRSRLLANPDLVSTTGEVIALIVGSNVELYKALLGRSDLEDNHLAPLEGKPTGDVWKQMARMALDAGFSVERVAGATRPSSGSLSGSEAEHWRPWKEAFEDLAQDNDEQLRQVGQAGLVFYGALVRDAEQRERDEELRGLGGEG